MFWKRAMIAFLLAFALLGAAANAEEITNILVDSRTTQSFTDAAVAEDDLRLILEAGLAATSAKAGLGDSPAAIIIYMNENTASPNAAFDCGLACENMFVMAKALGCGTKIVSSPTMQLNGANHDTLCEKLGVDPAYTAVSVLLIGHESEAADAVSSASVRNDFDEKVSIVK